VLIVMALAACVSMEPARAPQEQALQTGGGMAFLAVIPAQPAPASGYPVLIFLHGSGERGGSLDQVKLHGPANNALSDPDFQLLILAPHLAPTMRWDPDDVIAVLETAAARYSIDRNRIYLTGLSLGGHGTWATAAAYPDVFAAIVPIAGRGDVTQACALQSMPIWAFHGVADSVVPVTGSSAMTAAVAACGGSPRLTLYDGIDHDSWTQTYADPSLYVWLLSKRRP
jgi:predicted peptidase